jgi:hypothetical protein
MQQPDALEIPSAAGTWTAQACALQEPQAWNDQDFRLVSTYHVTG